MERERIKARIVKVVDRGDGRLFGVIKIGFRWRSKRIETESCSRDGLIDGTKFDLGDKKLLG